MAYLAAIDGGGSKTACIIGDEHGRVLGQGLSGGSNHQTVGADAAQQTLAAALKQALGQAGLALSQLSYIYYGLAGADLPPDYEVLVPLCRQISGGVAHEIQNDTWNGLRAGAPENWGVVSICGTGGACAGIAPDGTRVQLRNLAYEQGNRGGGAEILQHALHYAFRSDEQTGISTALQYEIPKLVGCTDMSAVLERLDQPQTQHQLLQAVPPLVKQLANQGDAICQRLLVDTGTALGEIAGSVIRKLGLGGQPVPVVMIGGVVQGDNPLLRDAYTLAVHCAAPQAQITVLQQPPVNGAYRLAQDAWHRISV